MKKILLSAYACEPHAGSEYGVGWNMAVNLSHHHKIYVLTRSRCRQKIEDELEAHPNLNLEFIFYDLPAPLYNKKEIGSAWGEQYNYIVWQLFVRKELKKLHKLHHFDLIHHLSFNQYRSPSPGFFTDIPFVLGPIGGAETIADCFTEDLEVTTKRKENIRKNAKDLVLFKWLCNRKSNGKHVLCSSKENMDKLMNYKGNATISLMPAIGFDPTDFKNLQLSSAKSETFELIYAGKLFDWKGIHIFLKAIKKAYIDNGIDDFVVKLIGLRFEKEQLTVNAWIQELGLANNVKVIPFMERQQLLATLTTGNLSVYPAFRDSGSMSVLEASVLGCPTICFNAGGQDAFPDDVLLKIEVQDSYEKTLGSFSENLLWAYRNPDKLTEIGHRAKEFVYENLTWEKKAIQINNIYKKLI